MQFFEQNSEYLVFIISLVIWIGIFMFQLKIDRNISKLESENTKEEIEI